MNAQHAINFIRESELITKASSSQRLVLLQEPKKNASCLVFQSEAVASFLVDKDFIAAADKHGFTFEPGERPPHNEMVYLSGNSNQRGAEVFETDSWCWKRKEAAPRLEIYFHLWVSEHWRGVVCEPHVWGNCSGGACHQPTVVRLVRCVAKHLPDPHPLLKVLGDQESVATIHWSAIDLGGVKSVRSLFGELYGKNKMIMELASSSLSPFDPAPRYRYEATENKDGLYVLEAEQTRLFQIWKEQLRAFKDSL